MTDKTIWKFEIRPGEPVEMPRNAEILTVQMQYGAPMLWAIVDPDEITEYRSIQVIGTGHPLPDNPRKYIGTFQIDGGRFVLHVFEWVKKTPPAAG